jgi:FAD/FMN-containing dehydrogenase
MFLMMSHETLLAYICPYVCNTDPLMQIYPNQNMCLLLDGIPPALQSLPYVMYPNCDVYNTNRFGYNKRYNLFPSAVIVPETETDVQYVLQALVQNNLPFSVRSGGHCLEPGSLSLGYIIDLRNFNAITPDVGMQTVFIGAGSRLGEVISTLGALDYAIPTGTCPSVGVAGLALGGGIGLMARKYGLTSDSILSMRVVTADGSIIDVTESSDPDLFWALRGAGANAYGIVLGFTFKMYFTPVVSFLRLTWDDWNNTPILEIAQTWQQWFSSQTTDITTEINFVYNNGVLELKINALKIGADPFTEWIDAFQQYDPTVNLYTGSYLGAADIFASNYTSPFSKGSSKYIFSSLSSQALDAIIAFFTAIQYNPCKFLLFLELGGASGGAIQQGDSAYFPRKAYAWIFNFAYWPYEEQSEQVINLMRKLYARIEPFTSPFSYNNLTNYDLGADYLHAYYGSNVERLIRIKNEVDPTNIFTWQQGIPLEYVPKSVLTQKIQGKYCA